MHIKQYELKKTQLLLNLKTSDEFYNVNSSFAGRRKFVNNTLRLLLEVRTFLTKLWNMELLSMSLVAIYLLSPRMYQTVGEACNCARPGWSKARRKRFSLSYCYTLKALLLFPKNWECLNDEHTHTLTLVSWYKSYNKIFLNSLYCFYTIPLFMRIERATLSSRIIIEIAGSETRNI